MMFPTINVDQGKTTRQTTKATAATTAKGTSVSLIVECLIEQVGIVLTARSPTPMM